MCCLGFQNIDYLLVWVNKCNEIVGSFVFKHKACVSEPLYGTLTESVTVSIELTLESVHIWQNDPE